MDLGKLLQDVSGHVSRQAQQIVQGWQGGADQGQGEGPRTLLEYADLFTYAKTQLFSYNCIQLSSSDALTLESLREMSSAREEGTTQGRRSLDEQLNW